MASEVDIYNLLKYQRSNQNTCLNQKPIVRKGDRVKKGDVIADGPATETGELALGAERGRRVHAVAGLQLRGLDPRLSERMVKDDVFTSIHIEEFECIARDTKLGKEEITRDIPNVGEEALKDLDESRHHPHRRRGEAGRRAGRARSPRRARPSSPPKRSCSAPSSARRPATCATARCACPRAWWARSSTPRSSRRKGVEKDERAKQIESTEEAKLLKDQNDEIKVIQDSRLQPHPQDARGQGGPGQARGRQGQDPPQEGRRPQRRAARRRSPTSTGRRSPSATRSTPSIRDILKNLEENKEAVKLAFGEKIARIKKGDELPPGVIKMVKVYVAIKRKLAVGDKMAGRHGNKGVVSRILPEEDMPYLEDGRPVDIVLNPLGVPSPHEHRADPRDAPGLGRQGRGRAAAAATSTRTGRGEQLKKQLKTVYDDKAFGEFVDDARRTRRSSALCQRLKKGIHVATPVFDGARETEIHALLRRGASCRARARWCSSTAAPASRSTRTSPWA